ncbi:MAG: glycosyl hydrolase [Clostridiales bacterium]|nr:glycosyl hydrolase [Clostridiales bacterium]
MMTHEEAFKRAKAIVDKMTVEEAASQLRYDAPAVERLGVPAYNYWNEALHGVARAGTATVFPQAIGLGATFDTELENTIGKVIAEEGRAKYNAQSRHGDRDIYKGLTFWSPNINIFRDPRWGRGQETFGEDPYLTSRMGVAFVRGLQGDGEHLKAAACAKHFAVHSGPEELRHEFDAVVSEKDLRETYLPAFEALVKEADVEAFMGAYNRTNGEPCCGHHRLMVEILRDEWKYKGQFVSDCWAIRDFHEAHHVTDTAPESAALALHNGCDVNCGNTYLHMLTAYQEGLVTEDEIRLAATRALMTRVRLGVLDGTSEFDDIPYSACDSDEHAAVSLQAARECMVLLKNDGILPLDPDKLTSVAVMGPNANSQIALEGNYSGTSSRYVTPLEGIREALKGKARVYYSEGSHLYRNRMSNLSQPKDRLAEAAALAEECDVSILCLGLDSTIEGEQGDTGNEFSSGDKKTLDLPESQRLLLKTVLNAGKPVIVLMLAGSAMSIDEGNAILQCWYPGQAGGTAIADILFGKAAPCGKLPVTFYRSVDDLPDFCDYAMKNRTYRYYEGEALYPFGFGLSYTDFEYSGASYADGKVTVTVKNAGGMAAKAVTQVYVKDLESPFAVRNTKLCAFRKDLLQPGEEKQITLPLSADAFACWDDKGVKAVRSSRFILYVADHQCDERSVALSGSNGQAICVNL